MMKLLRKHRHWLMIVIAILAIPFVFYFVQNGLSPNGLGEEHIEQLVRDELSLNQIKQLLAAGVSIPAAEIKTNYDRAYDILSVNLIRLRPADFEKDIKITDEDVQKYY